MSGFRWYLWNKINVCISLASSIVFWLINSTSVAHRGWRLKSFTWGYSKLAALHIFMCMHRCAHTCESLRTAQGRQSERWDRKPCYSNLQSFRHLQYLQRVSFWWVDRSYDVVCSSLNSYSSLKKKKPCFKSWLWEKYLTCCKISSSVKPSISSKKMKMFVEKSDWGDKELKINKYLY